MQVAFSCLGKADSSPVPLEDIVDVILQWRKQYEDKKAQLKDAGLKATATGKWPGLKQAKALGGKSREACKANITKILR